MAKAQAQEPSMEEILASIRRIIADEDKAPAAEAEPAAEDDDAEHVSEEDLDRLFASGAGDADDDDAAPEAAAEIDPFDIEIPEDDEDEDDVLDLTEEAVDDTDLDLIEAQPEDVTFADPEPPQAPVMQRAAASAPPRPQPASIPASAPAPAAGGIEPLISGQVGMAVSAAFSNLNNVVTHRGGHTIEELVQEMIRPMLRTWLDENLPPMVERLVRAEIERVARGGR